MAFIFQLFHRLIPVQQNDIIFQLFIIGMVISKCIVTVWVYLRVICELGMDESIWNIWLVLWQKYIKAFQHWACHYMIPLNLPHPWPVTQHFTLSGFFFFTDCNLFLVWFKNVLFFQDWPSFSMLYFDHEDSGCNYQSTITPGSAYIPSSDVRSLDMAIAYSQSTNLRTRHHFHGNITE